MKILAVADEECAALWDYYTPGMLKDYGLILSSGDLKGEYLSFLVTMARCPVLYVHGNHDTSYEIQPPEGCDCVDDKLVICKGLRILGLGGCRQYSRGKFQYTEQQMEKRIRKLKRAIRLAGGVDIVLSHAAPRGAGDTEDMTHRGFEAFWKLIDTYHPRYLIHGHVHMNYGTNIPRVVDYGGTPVINCCQRYELTWEQETNPRKLNRLQRLYAKWFVKNYENMDVYDFFGS